jgi:predicted permease
MALYALLLRLYPSSFRAEYGAEMRAVFARRRRDATSMGALIVLWAETMRDVLVNAGRLHAEMLRQDLAYTLRTLRRAPAFTLTTILVAALGIGATTAAFSIADHVLVRPLPFADADRLVKLWQNQAYRGNPRLEVSPPNFLDWQRMATTVEAMSAYTTRSVNLSGDVEPVRLDGVMATPEFFGTLGAQAAIGRVFVPGDAAETVVLSDRLWRDQFRADPNVLGRRVLLDDTPHVVVGVMPTDFLFPWREVRFWVPLMLPGSGFQERNNFMLYVVARRAPGTTIEEVRSEMGVIAASLEQAYPVENDRTGIAVTSLRDDVNSRSRMLLIALVGASLCVLLIACTNLAGLLLSRALARQRELAVRAAIGAGRERLVRQMLTEALTLAIAGGVLGMLLAIAAGPLLARLVPTLLPIAELPGVNLRMLLLAAAATLVTGLGFGVVPALRASRQSDAHPLRDSGRVGASRRTERLRSGLIVAQVASSIVLLISAGLLVRALWEVQQRDPGFRTDGVLTLRTTLPTPKYAPTLMRAAFYERVLSEVRVLPGVSSAGYTSFAPLTWRGGIWNFALDGEKLNPSDSRKAIVRYVTSGTFDALHVPIVRGRDISETDTRERPYVAVISESFAKKYWPGQDPVGRRLDITFDARTVVGIVGDVRVRGLELESEPQVYLPYRQIADRWLMVFAPKDLLIRSSLSAAQLLPSVRDIIRRADPQQPISDVRPLADLVDGDTAPRRVQVRVLGAFAAMALLLAGVGIHGLLAFAVSTRVREIGVRLALGARRQDVLHMVLRQGVALAVGGAILGLGLAYGAGRLLDVLLAGISPADPMTFVAAVGFVLAIAIIGSLLPAIRASRVDPTTAMRAE